MLRTIIIKDNVFDLVYIIKSYIHIYSFDLRLDMFVQEENEYIERKSRS